MKPYEVVDHTADIGIDVTGADLRELFEMAGFAFFDISWDLSGVAEVESYEIRVEEPGVVDLLIGFLRELLYLNQAEGLIFVRFVVEAVGPSSLRAVGFGERLREGEHRCKLDIKGVTYHQAAVEEGPEGFRARVVFDI